MKEYPCKFCKDGIVRATRSDAKRCFNCRQEYLREYRKRPEVRAKRREALRRLRQAVLDGYGGACECCGETAPEFLAVDHVNGGGRQERKTLSTWMIATKIIQNGFPDTYRLLCHNCNQSIGWYGGCPHNPSWKRTA